MATALRRMNAAFLRHWVLATSLGWILGFIAAFAAAYLVNLFAANESNLLVGLCIGAMIGAAQQRVLRQYKPVSAWWILASAIGLGGPFILLEILENIGLQGTVPLDHQFLVRTFGWGALGGLFSALLQSRCLKQYYKTPAWWLAINSVAWGMCWMLCSLPGMFALLGALTGGVVVGTITGIGLMLMPRIHSASLERSDLQHEATVPEQSI